MLRNTSRSRNFFRKLVVDGVKNSKTALQNDCLMRLYDADAELKAISSELDSFDGKKEPVRCNLLVNQLRTAQDKVISLLFQLMDDCSCERASRDYRMKFPDEILLSEGSESLNGQIWFGAECLSAGSNILNHTKESTMLRPMAKTLTTHLDSLRNDLRDLVINGGGASRINQDLIKKMVAFDHIFATFEYDYVRTMLPIRTVAEIEKLQEVAVLFSETLIDCVKRGLIKQDDIDEFQPIVMIAIPRLAIVRGLLYKNENPIYTRHKSHMCSLFQPFHGPLHSIRKLLRGLSPKELFTLEKMLSNDQTPFETPTKEHNSEEVDQDDTQMAEPNLQNSLSVQGEASTSNNFSNVLMDGLQYPVGQKIDVECEEQQRALEQSGTKTEYDDKLVKNLRTPSSSRSCNSNDHSPVGTSNSLSECKAYCVERVKKTTESSTAHDCDKNCCLSPPESDAQLESLIAEFGPTMTSEYLNNSSEHTATRPPDKTVSEVKSKKPSTSKSRRRDTPVEDEALLEELFIKQAQQLLHRLFVAISGVADQLQSNFASDLRFILRHIFSTELEDEDDEGDNDVAENDDDPNNDNSDSSLPIEQGIEAQEVTNLIDLGSGYSMNAGYECETDGLYPQQAQIGIRQNNNPNADQYSASSLQYAHMTSSSMEPISRIVSQGNSFDGYDNELLGDLTRGTGQSYVSDNSRSREFHQDSSGQPIQQYVHQQILITRGSDRSSSTSSSSSRSHRNIPTVEDNRNQSSLISVDRRPRRHGASRSRRSRGPPIWVPDQLVVACSCCNASFTLFRRRHHCRACGQIFCGECSKFTRNLDCWGYNGPVRVCEACFNQP